MPVLTHCESLPLSTQEITRLWQKTIEYRQCTDEIVAVACVSEEEIQGLNRRYRNKDKPTNVLTFSYEGEHDVVVCLSVVQREAQERKLPLKEYTALVLVHAFLHVAGLNHEESAAAARQTDKAERAILEQAGFTAHNL